MKQLFSLKQEIIIILITAAPLVYLLLTYSSLPEQLPMHWNIKGEVDNYGPKYYPFLLTPGMYFLLLIIPLIDPRKKNYEKFLTVFFRIRLLLTIFFSLIIATIVYAANGHEVAMGRIIGTGILALFTFLGNYMINIKPNWMIGIRTPWTLDNETVWKKTHQTGGRLWFYGGMTLLIISFFLNETSLFYLIATGVITLSIIPVVYSYNIYKKEKKKNQ